MSLLLIKGSTGSVEDGEAGPASRPRESEGFIPAGPALQPLGGCGVLQVKRREQFLPCHKWGVFPLKSKDLLCWFSPGLISVHNSRDHYLCLCSSKLQQLMDCSRTKTQPDQAALVLRLFTISTSFAPSGCCARDPALSSARGSWLLWRPPWP